MALSTENMYTSKTNARTSTSSSSGWVGGSHGAQQTNSIVYIGLIFQQISVPPLHTARTLVFALHLSRFSALQRWWLAAGYFI